MPPTATQHSETGPPGEPLDLLLSAFEKQGWTITLRDSVGGVGPNPTRVDLTRGQHRLRLLLYAWYATNEGRGRKPKGQEDYRIQTTRTHDGPLLADGSRITIGIGWNRQRKVFAAFDGWTKRETGSSSSVHLKRALLDQAAADGWATDGPRWDARLGFTPANVERLLQWIDETSQRREALIDPVDYELHDEDHATIVGDIWAGKPTGWLRLGDYIVLVDHGKLANRGVWKIVQLDGRPAPPTESGRYNRTHVYFECVRVGRIADPNAIESLQ